MNIFLGFAVSCSNESFESNPEHIRAILNTVRLEVSNELNSKSKKSSIQRVLFVY